MSTYYDFYLAVKKDDMICVSEDGMHFTGDHSFYSNMNAYKFMISAMHNSSEY